VAAKIVTLQIARREHAPGVTVLELAGSILAGPDCQRLQHEFETIAPGNQYFVLDLSGVTHVDSAAIGTIVMCFSHVKKAGGKLCLAGAKGMVQGTLKLTQVDKVIHVYPTAAEAAASLS
jgi:anti-sigma B factor antagonist